MGIHQLDQAIFPPVLPEDIDGKPFPAFPRRGVWKRRRRAFRTGALHHQSRDALGVELMPHQYPEIPAMDRGGQ